VQAILGPNYATGVSLAPFIESATDVVDGIVECAAEEDVTLTSTRLELIERWLSAHFYHCSDPVYQSRSTEGASGQFQGQSAMGYDGSRYGQMAMRLDTSGCLRANEKGGKASFIWLGKPVSDQINYQDRD
jgi:hypothetical protein